MSEIPRYDWNEGDEFDGPYLSANTRGDWVKYADHLKELEELRERNRYLLDENDGLESAVSAHEGEAAYALERSALLAAANVELDALRAQLRSKDEQLAGMREWISVKDKMPTTGSLCWIVWADVVQATAYRRFGIGFACKDGYAWEAAHGEGDAIPDAEVTHWQPLPAPPTLSGPSPAQD